MSAQWLRLAPATALPVGQAVRVDVDGRAIALFRTPRGLCAVDAHCPHAGGPLHQGEVTAEQVTCPWHRWRYSLRTGARHDREGQPLNVYPARIADGWLWLDPEPQSRGHRH